MGTKIGKMIKLTSKSFLDGKIWQEFSQRRWNRDVVLCLSHSEHRSRWTLLHSDSFKHVFVAQQRRKTVPVITTLFPTVYIRRSMWWATRWTRSPVNTFRLYSVTVSWIQRAKRVSAGGFLNKNRQLFVINRCLCSMLNSLICMITYNA